MKKILMTVLSLGIAAGLLSAQEIHRAGAVTTAKDIEKAEAILSGMNHLFGSAGVAECEACIVADAPVETADLMVYAGKYLLGTPYVAGTLEGGDREELRIYLTQTDCILFVETCLNLALTKKEGGSTFEDLAEHLRWSRYRDGKVEHYSDRIHYTTEWIRLKEAAGILKDITLDLGGEKMDKKIDFMSRKYKSYKHLADADTDPVAAQDRAVIASVENRLNEVPMTFIPGDRIRSVEDGIRTGDIICYMSGVEGLDIAHVAMAYVHGGKVGFMHASQADGKVEVDPLSIAEYVAKRKNCPGIKVIRVL